MSKHRIVSLKVSMRSILITGLLLMSLFSADLRSQQRQKEVAADSVFRLEDLEQMALQQNPTIAQSAAAVRAARGRKIQSGLYPNPSISYSGEELQFRVPGKTNEHLIFLEQTIVTTGRLSYAQDVFGYEETQAEIMKEAQKARVLNAVRILYFEVLGAQRLLELRRELARIAREAVEITEELYNVGQADRPDVLEIEVEAEQAELELMNAGNDLERAWQMLAAVVGNPVLPRVRLAGDLESQIQRLDQDSLLAVFLAESPELKVARAGIERANSNVSFAEAVAIPDVSIRVGAGYNYEQFAVGQRVGLEGAVQLRVPLPLFNRNQGNIEAAKAELDRSQQEVQRRELALRSRMTTAYRDYLTSLQSVEKYQKEILPRAQQAYEMYLRSFRQMAAAYPQVLIAQRTFFQVNAEYVKDLVDLHQRVIVLQGFLLTGGLDMP